MGKTEPPLLIAIVGLKHSGKDTAADALTGARRVAFADPIKRMLMVGLGLTHAECYDQGLKEKPLTWLDGKTPRELMISLGSGWGRGKVAKDLWLRVLLRSWEFGQGQAVITDVRMQNEVNMLREYGATILHLRRGKRENLFQRWKRRLFAPDSEQVIAPLSGELIILNNCSLAEFQHRVRCAVANIPTNGVFRAP